MCESGKAIGCAHESSSEIAPSGTASGSASEEKSKGCTCYPWDGIHAVDCSAREWEAERTRLIAEREEMIANISDAISTHCAKFGDIGYHDQPLDQCARQLVADYDSLQVENTSLREHNQNLKELFDGKCRGIADAWTRERKLESQLTALQQAQGWRGMETAPKDTAVLTWRGAGLMAVAENIPDPRLYPREVRRIWCCTDGMELLNVTHWMPLPSPPARTEEPTPLRELGTTGNATSSRTASTDLKG